MPRRYYSYLPEFQQLHNYSSLGSYILGVGILIMIVYLYRSLKTGAQAPLNPWGGTTLEWQAKSPPVHENFDTDFVLNDPYLYKSKEDL